MYRTNYLNVFGCLCCMANVFLLHRPIDSCCVYMAKLSLLTNVCVCLLTMECCLAECVCVFVDDGVLSC